MCRERLAPGLCWNFICPHNLFWEQLMLDMDKTHITKKALEISNCCCLIRKPWTEGEIESAWGLPKLETRRSERLALEKICVTNRWAS
jgi:hypothetical protein